MNERVTRKLSFFRDCLDAESRSQVVWNFPTRKSSNVRAVEQLSALLTVDKDYLDKVGRVLKFYTREKQLVLSALFLIGDFAVPTFGGGTRRRSIKCPIFLFTCKLDQSAFGARGIEVDLSRGVVNPAASQILETYNVDVDEHLPRISAALNDGQSEQLTRLIKQLSASLSSVSEGAVGLKGGCFLSVEAKQASARGSLYELEQLISKRAFSPPLSAVLGELPIKAVSTSSFWESIFTWRLFSEPAIPMPEVLSDAQNSVLQAAEDYPLSVASGPPGTGKSFTIACLALKEFSQGNSVLVVSQNQHAADVVRRKLIDRMGIEPGLTMLGSEQGVSRDAKQQIKLMLSRFYKVDKPMLKTLRTKISDLIQQCDKLEADYLISVDEQSNADGVGQVPKRRGAFWRFDRTRKTTGNPLLFEQFLALEEQEQALRQAVIDLFRLRYELTAKELSNKPASKQSLQSFADSLTARNEHYQEKYYDKVRFEHVLKAIPLWFCAVGNLNRVLPMDRQMFDLVIIDEATQCNMAVALPALQRARRAVIVGDQKQLKHVSFVSYQLQQKLAQQHGIDNSELSIDFRNTSVLDYAMSACKLPQQSVLLDEHFRSHPQIIEFSNQEFYQSRLKIMTERPTNRQRSIDVIRVEGRRLSKGLNKQEAASLLDKLKQIIEIQRSLPETEVHTLGVLAFFSTQAEWLEKQVFDNISLNDMRRHNIRVGTPFSFQGEERDHMLISCSVDAKTGGGSYTYLNRDDVFNVAITRARDYQTLFVSCAASEVRSGSKLSAYLKYVDEYQAQVNLSDSRKHDAFQSEICDWLTKRGIEIHKNYMVAGIHIDIMAVYHGHAVAIDLVGFEGHLAGALSLTKFRLLQRAGLESFLLPYKEWREQKEALLGALMLRLGAAHKASEGSKAVDNFTDAQEQLFGRFADGVSINTLNARFKRHEEMVASEQLHGIVQRHDHFLRLLELNFLPQEITFRRYLNSLHHVLGYCIENLQTASVATELANSMLEQQKKLFGEATLLQAETSNESEFDDVITARMDMIDQQRASIKRLLADNEKALLQIDKTMVKLNELSAEHQGKENEIDPIIDLQELTERLELFRGKTRGGNTSERQ